MGFLNFLDTYFNKSVWGMISELCFVLALTIAISFLVSKVLKQVRKGFLRTETIWDEAIIDSLANPVYMLIWVFGVSIGLEILNKDLNLEYARFIKPLRPAAVMLAFAWFIFGTIDALEKHWGIAIKKGNSKLDKTTAGALAKILRIITIAITGMMALETFGFSISGVLAFAGGGGVAVGFASKDLLANFFGALMIYLDKPFRLGEWIRIPEKNIEGYVEKIGLRCTVIRTFEKRPLYVPNSYFTSIPIENPSRMSHRRISETIGLRHEDLHAIDEISSDVQKMLLQHPEVDTDQQVTVNISSFNATSIDLLIYAFTKKVKTEEFYKVKHEIMLKVAKIVEKSEAKLANNTTYLTIPQESTLYNKGAKRGAKRDK